MGYVGVSLVGVCTYATVGEELIAPGATAAAAIVASAGWRSGSVLAFPTFTLDRFVAVELDIGVGVHIGVRVTACFHLRVAIYIAITVHICVGISAVGRDAQPAVGAA